MDIEELLTRHEGKTLEFKRDASSPRGIVRTVVAFANSAGGTVLIGVADRTRDVVGVADPLELEERLASILVDSISPRMAPEIDVVAWRDTAVLAIRVPTGSSRPYHVTAEGEPGGVYVRVGSTNRHADASMVEELQRAAAGRSYDEEPLRGVGPEDIDVEAVRMAFGDSRRITPAALRTLRLLTEIDGRPCATVGGVLLFGSDRSRHFPDAAIDVARFAGTTRSTFTDAATFGETLPVALDHTLAFVRRSIVRGYAIEGARGVERWQYPLTAVREVIVNAVVHADYSVSGARTRVAVFDDRMEIDSPGLLMPGLTVDDIRRGVSRVRNRTIARVFRELGLIEQWGTGIPRAIEACRAAGLAEPRIEEIGVGVRVTLFAEGGEACVDALSARLLDALSDAGPLSTGQLAEYIGRTPRSTRDRLRALVDSGLVVEVGSSRNDPRRTYYVAEDAAPYRSQ